MPRPDKYPRWASQDVTDPVSLSPNVIEPPEEKKSIGWNRLEKPPRNWENWLHRKIYEWIVYFDQNLDFDSGSFVPVWSGIDASALVAGPNIASYILQGNMCHFNIETDWTGNASTSSMQISNLPFPAKNLTGFNQLAVVKRGPVATIPGGSIPINIFGFIPPNTTVMLIYAENLFTGISSQIAGISPPGNAYAAGSAGRLIISGSYFIQEV